MATGLEMYDALRAATRELPLGSNFVVNINDALDLKKLTVSDLRSRDYSEQFAEEVSSSLLKGNLGPLGQSMGIHLIKDKQAPRLILE